MISNALGRIILVKNNVTRFLDNRKITYQVFELPEEKLGAEEVAMLLGTSSSQVYKSIVILRKGKGKPILAVVPGDREVNLKKLAKTLGEKKVTPATQNEAEKMTRLQVGGISPLALINRGFDIVIHQAVEELDQVHVSGGERGLNIRLPTRDLINLVRGRLADIC
jgi:Cys-tRNA(Pro)/Cys-tRNA(Cys) deacylase